MLITTDLIDCALSFFCPPILKAQPRVYFDVQLFSLFFIMFFRYILHDSTEKRSLVLYRWDGKDRFYQYFKVRSQRYRCLWHQSRAIAQSLKTILSIFFELFTNNY